MTEIPTWRETRAPWGSRRCRQGWTHLGQVMQYWVRLHFMDNSSKIYSPHLGKSLWLHTLGQTPAGFAQIQLFGLKHPEKNILWEMAAQFQVRNTGKGFDPGAANPWGLALPKARDYLLLQKREGRGTEGYHKERERAGMGSSLLDLQLFSKNLFISIGLLTARPEGEGKGFHLPSIYGHHWTIPPIVWDSHFSIPLWEHKKNPSCSSKAIKHLGTGTEFGILVFRVFYPTLPQKFHSSTVVLTSLEDRYFKNHWKTDSSGNIFMPLANKQSWFICITCPLSQQGTFLRGAAMVNFFPDSDLNWLNG